MTISSVPGKGLIHAGDTPLACTIAVEQTGPMQLTVRAGAFTSIGQADVADYHPMLHDVALSTGWGERITHAARVCWPVHDERGGIIAVNDAPYFPDEHDALLDAGHMALVPERTRVRLWRRDADRARTYVLAADQVFDLAAADLRVTWRGWLVTTDEDAVAVLLQARPAGGDYPALPDGWTTISLLIGDFTVEPRSAELPDIHVLTVVPGFPAATEPEDWRKQEGDTDGGPVVLPVQILALGRALKRARKLVTV